MELLNDIPEKYRSLELQFLSSLYHEFNINVFSKQESAGGNKKNKQWNIKFVDNTGHYTFRLHESTLDNTITQLSNLSTTDDDCITVLIDKSQKVAILHNISYYNNCAIEGLKKPGGGSILLRFIINYLINNQDKYSIKRIVLTDNSYLQCNNCDDTVKLAQLRMITHGHTWYMKYGFLPYDANKKVIDRNLIKAVKYNNQKIKKIKITNIPILKISKNIKEINIKKLQRLIKKYLLLKEFIIRISQEYEKYCCLLVYIMDYLYNAKIDEKPYLIDFYKKAFVMEL